MAFEAGVPAAPYQVVSYQQAARRLKMRSSIALLVAMPVDRMLAAMKKYGRLP